MTREEFENIVYTYRCITFDSNLGFINDPNKVNSSEVTVDPPGEYTCDSSLAVCTYVRILKY